jgi:hypothetical protein
MRSLQDALRRVEALWAGRPEPVRDDAGRVARMAICEKRFLEVNGTAWRTAA